MGNAFLGQIITDVRLKGFKCKAFQSHLFQLIVKWPGHAKKSEILDMKYLLQLLALVLTRQLCAKRYTGHLGLLSGASETETNLFMQMDSLGPKQFNTSN